MSSDEQQQGLRPEEAADRTIAEEHPHPHDHPAGERHTHEDPGRAEPGHPHPAAPDHPDDHEHEDGHEHDEEHEHDHRHGHGRGAHGHSHGMVDRSIVRSRAGVKAVSVSLAVLVLASLFQLAIFVLSGSVALLADLIHNFGDASTAIPLGIAFFLRSFRGEKLAGLFVVATIFVSACVALYETIQRFINPQHLSHLWALAAAGVVGFIGNEIAAYIRYRAGKRLSSPALIADGNHARVDGFVSLGVVASAIGVGLGANIADPIIGLVITLVIMKITWDSWRTVRTTEPGELVEPIPEH